MIGRRGFLNGGLALGCSAAAFPLMTPVAFAAAPWDQRLFVIVLRGAMDGLDVVRPYGDPDYAALRPTLSSGRENTLDLDGFFALHAGMSDLFPLWQGGELGFCHAVSTPYRDKRSHFDGQDLLEAGGAVAGEVRGGWLNRLVEAVPGVESDIAYAVGREQMLILSGAAHVSRWSPEAQLDLTPQARRLLELVYEGDPLFEQASAEAVAIAESLSEEGGSNYSGSGHIQLAAFAAGRLREESRIASFSLSGWDTHARQEQSLTKALKMLSETILTLKAELGPDWGKTTVLAVTEFGRTAAENGNRGTDHGTGGLMVTAGGGIRGGRVLGNWPGLSEADLYDRRDLMPTRDVRSLAAWAMKGAFGINDDVLTGSIFPSLEMGADPGFLG